MLKIQNLTKNKDKIIRKAVTILKNGGLVVFPSDTVYGLLADAINEKAVSKLISFKQRPPGKPISVFSDFQMLDKIVEVNEKQRKTIDNLLPGPFTVILKSKGAVSKRLESEKGTLGIRIPDYKLINKLVSSFGKPITATSANISGKSPHYSIETLLKELSEKKKQRIDLIVDSGKLPRNKPSTVVDLTEPEIKIIRRGDIVFKDEQTFVSRSEGETKNIAKHVLQNVILAKARIRSSIKSRMTLEKPLVFIIEGELGVGKTVFVKGIGEHIGIENIISPTFVVYYEYEIKNFKLIHVDLYNLTDDEEFEYLGLEEYLKPRNVLCFEWGEKAGKIFNTLIEKGKVIYIKMSYKNEKEREIKINY